MSQRTRRWGFGAVGALAAILAAAGTWFVAAPPAPAVILVVIDCLGADRFGPDTMPRTWALATEGWRFEHALAQSSWTRSAVGSIFTGRWPIEHQLYRLKPAPDRLADDIPTLAEAFAAEGYTTGAFAQQAQLDPAFGLGRGFARYGFRDGTALDINQKFTRWNTLHRHAPRFAYLHYVDIHKPYTPDPRFAPPVKPSAASMGLTDAESWVAFMGEVNRGERTLNPDEWAALEALHVGEIRQLDAALGELWDHLDADGTLASSWVVITADHGEAFGQHGWFTHGNVPHAELVEVPLVIRPPGGREGTVVPGHPRQVDLASTLLGFVGLPPMSGSGRDLGPALRGERVDDVVSFAEYHGEADRLIGVRADRWSLLRGAGGDRLYDLRNDPTETRDVALAHPERAAELGALADGYLRLGSGGTTAAGATEPGTIEGLKALGYID